MVWAKAGAAVVAIRAAVVLDPVAELAAVLAHERAVVRGEPLHGLDLVGARLARAPGAALRDRPGAIALGDVDVVFGEDYEPCPLDDPDCLDIEP